MRWALAVVMVALQPVFHSGSSFRAESDWEAFIAISMAV